FILFYFMKKKIGGLNIADIMRPLARTASAGCVMALACAAMSVRMGIGAHAQSSVRGAAQLFIVILSGIAVFVVSAALAGVKEIRNLPGWILKRR
ncbi:hypothetical protein ACFL42_03465, partial [Candidatus Omnitrophota bacterium]